MQPNIPNKAFCAGIFLFLMMAFSSEFSHAQFKAVIQIGMNGSSFRGGNLENTSPIVRFGGGAALRYEYPSGFEFEAGVNYVTKGSGLEGKYQEIPIEGTSEITYIEVPILIGYRFRQTSRFSPRIVAGPAMAFKTDAQIRFNAVGSNIEQQEDDLTVEDKDLGIVLGADVNAKFGSEILNFGIRTTFGYSNARTAKPEIFNTSVSMMMGIVF